MKTAIVILNWNTKDYLDKFLPYVIASATDAEVIVADNASTDGSLELMEEKFPSIRTIKMDKNYGFTGGYNKAFEAIKEDGFKYYLLLNTDVEVPEGWLEPMTEWMETHPDCGACAPKLHSWKDKEYFEYAGAAGGLLDKYGYPFCRGRVMSHIEKDEGQYDEPKNVLWATGACLMLRSDLYWQLGGLDNRFFAHMEEIDLCWRMQLSGYKITVIPKSTVWHIGGGTLPNNSPWKLKLNFRNNLLMLENNLAKTYALSMPASKAYNKARRKIRHRMILDGMSAIVYLMLFRFSSFKAVLDAHNEYRKMRIRPELEELKDFYNNNKGNKVEGLFPKWIIPLSILKGKRIFELVHRI